MALAELQTTFAQALVQPSSTKLPTNFGTQMPDDEKHARFRVYRNNVFKSLETVLEGVYPDVKQVVGNDFFAQLCQQYVINFPPHQAALIHFGDQLPMFLDSVEAAHSIKYVVDLARYEWFRHEAYYAADAEAIPVEAFASIDIQTLTQARFNFHPSLRLLQSPFAVFTLHQYVNTEQANEETLNIDHAEHLLIMRADDTVVTLPLDEGNFFLFDALMKGLPLAEAIDSVATKDPTFDAANAMGALVSSQTVVDIIST